jgi:hypothetical protein
MCLHDSLSAHGQWLEAQSTAIQLCCNRERLLFTQAPSKAHTITFHLDLIRRAPSTVRHGSHGMTLPEGAQQGALSALTSQSACRSWRRVSPAGFCRAVHACRLWPSATNNMAAASQERLPVASLSLSQPCRIMCSCMQCMQTWLALLIGCCSFVRTMALHASRLSRQRSDATPVCSA